MISYPDFSKKFPGFKKPDGTMHYYGEVYNRPKFKAKLFAINPMCQLCKKPIATLEEATLDHIIPKALGGHTVKWNLQLAHGDCNIAKGSKWYGPIPN